MMATAPLVLSSSTSPVVVESSAEVIIKAGVQAIMLEKPSKEMRVNIILEEHSKLTFISLATQTTDTKRTITLKGTGSEYHEQTIIIGKNNDHIDVTSTVINEAKESKANVEVRGIIDDNAQADVIGNMKVKHGACKSDSRLSQHLLLLGNGRAQAFPYLEIDENDVSAGHAATVRPIDPDHLFYLRSRGLSESEARRLLVRSFVMPALLKLPAALQDQVEQHLGDLNVLLA